MNLNTIAIKDFFNQILYERRLSKEGYMGTDLEMIISVLLRSYDETLSFLSTATVQEIGCAIDALEDLVQSLPKEKAQAIIDIFKNKALEFPNVQDFSEVEYALELKIAQEIVDEKSC